MREALKWASTTIAEASGDFLLQGATTHSDIEPPVPTRRAQDDEPTVMRALYRGPDELAATRAGSPLDSAPPSSGLLTSAPVIPRTREVPVATGEVGAEQRSDLPPSTARVPDVAGLADTGETLVDPRPPAPDVGGKPPMPADEVPISAESVSRAIEVNLTFTRPMAAMVMPDDYVAPLRPASAPKDPSGRAPALPSSAPLALHPPLPSAPPPPASTTSSAQGIPAAPGGQLAPRSAMAEATVRVTRPPDRPGRGRAASIAAALALGLVAVLVAVLVVRARAVGARAAANAARSTSPATRSRVATASSVFASPSAAEARPAATATTPEPLPEVVPSAAAPAAPVASVKRPKAKPKKKAPPKPAVDPGDGEPAAAPSVVDPPPSAPTGSEPSDPAPRPAPDSPAP
jgi:hypothetical protein